MSRNRGRVFRSLAFTEKKVVKGLELVKHCETCKWNTQFQWESFQWENRTSSIYSKNFPVEHTKNCVFHLHPNQNFCVNGKHPYTAGSGANNFEK